MNLLDRTIQQFDTLILYLSFSHEEVFDIVATKRESWRIEKETMPKTYEIFKQQIIQSAFILGYSYFENFLTDLLRQIYKSRPKMLPKNRGILSSDIIHAENYEKIIELLIDKEILICFINQSKI